MSNNAVIIGKIDLSSLSSNKKKILDAIDSEIPEYDDGQFDDMMWNNKQDWEDEIALDSDYEPMDLDDDDDDDDEGDSWMYGDGEEWQDWG